MNIVKLLIGIALIGLVTSYPLLGSLGLAALGLPWLLVLIVGIVLAGIGIKLVIDGLSE